MITFNPGPSQISPFIVRELTELASSGQLSISHRSKAFSEISKQAINGIMEKMSIPASYKIFYQPSATASMDTILRNLVTKKSFHFANGSFSNLFYQTGKDIGLEALGYETEWGQSIDWRNAKIPDDTELICITHNETSTGVMWPTEEISDLRKAYPKQLLAIDATSTFGCLKMNWEEADVWFGSVQKCLGLPSGLGYIIIGPRAYEVAKKAIHVACWQSLAYMDEKMKLFQTPETPNMLIISLLGRQMSQWNLVEIEKQLYQKAKMIYEAKVDWKPFVSDERWRSSTVPCFYVDDPERMHKRAKDAGMVLGKGYGHLTDTTIRIANFPAVTIENLQKLLDILST
jgi:phosphoserine aminotransferase